MSEPSKDAANIDRLLYTGPPAARADGGFKDLGITPLVRQLGLSSGAGYASIVVIVALRLVSVWQGWESPQPTDVLRAARRWSKGAADDTPPT